MITGDADIDHDQVGMLRRFWAWERSLGSKIDCMQKTPLPASSPKSPLFYSSSYSGRRTKEIRLNRLVGLGPLIGEASIIEGIRILDSKHLCAHPGSYHVLALNSLDLCLLICKMGILASSSQGCENQVRYECTCGTSWAPSK